MNKRFLILSLFALSPSTAGAQFYRMNAQSVTACGGYGGNDCFTVQLEGEIEVDPNPSAPRILYSDITEIPYESVWPAPGLIDLSELSGQWVASGTLKFIATTENQSIELTIRPTGDGTAMLNGHYHEGCCDRYGFSFENVLLDRVSYLERRRLNLRSRVFTIEATWSLGPGTSVAHGHASYESDSWGYLWFFSPESPEVIVKIIDTCTSPSPHSHWVFASGLTNLGVDLTVRDNVGRRSRTYQSLPGQSFAPILDTSSFFEPCF
ncbi:MAG: hypothetical protein K8J08_05550 [Thermoanaerobaculia bacterium]|nr:hypothetical protein [Thermoanaerobaculia bacterium]